MPPNWRCAEFIPQADIRSCGQKNLNNFRCGCVVKRCVSHVTSGVQIGAGPQKHLHQAQIASMASPMEAGVAITMAVRDGVNIGEILIIQMQELVPECGIEFRKFFGT